MNLNDSTEGRWLTPDPRGGDITNPQSLNRYAYALNNPATLTDPSGLCPPCNFKSYMPLRNDIGDEFDYIFPSGIDDEGNFVNYFDPGGLAFVTGNFGSFFGGTISITSYGTPGGGSASVPPSLISEIKNVSTCAAGFADKYSIAGGLHALGIGNGGISGFFTNALGGNAFSGATNLVTSFFTGSAGGHNVFYNMAQSLMAGPLQGVPGGRGPWGASISDLATGAIARGAFSAVTGAGQTLQTLNGTVSLASTGIDAAEFATGVGLVKFGYDALSYGVGLLGCKAGVIQ